MTKGLSIRKRLIFTGLVTLLVWIHLLWDRFHGGVPTHYLFRRDDLPGISNWWGGLTLPLVTCFLLFWINKNWLKSLEQKVPDSEGTLIMRFIGALVFGILLSVFFTMGSPAPGYMMLAATLLSFFLPLYRPEYLLGFVLGMSYTFGANLPILFAFIFMLLFLISYKLIRSGVLLLFRKAGQDN